MDKMKMQDVQLTKAGGLTTSTDDDQSIMTGTRVAQVAKALPLKGQ